MIALVLMGIFVLFVLFAFMRQPIYKRFGFKICSICAAVTLAWIVLLILKIFAMEIDNLLLGILMGESVMAFMYMFEHAAKKEGKNKLLWLKIVIILLGTLLVSLFLTQGFSLSLFIVLSISVILAIIIYGSLKSKKSTEIVRKKYGKFQKEINKLEKQLENCCD